MRSFDEKPLLRRATKTFQTWKRNTFVDGKKKRSNEEESNDYCPFYRIINSDDDWLKN